MSWLIHDPLTRFLVQIVAIIAACRGLGVVARRLGQPIVIAEISAGIVLGPSVLGWVAPEVAVALFPPGSLGVVRLVSQLGLLLFMFLVGLELDIRMLQGRTRSSLVISQASIAVPFALGVLLALWLRVRFAPAGVSFVAFALFVGAAMSITAFPVLARILAERRLLRTRVGAVTIACAAIDDVVAWCILAFAVSVAQTSGLHGAVVTTLLAFAYITVMLLVVRPLLARLAARVSTPDAMSQNVVASVLLLVLVSSWVTERIGIHVLFGAFLFGVVLPKQGGFARALAEKLEDVVVVILLPLFFAVSGLRTEIAVLGTPSNLLACGAIILAASVGKFGGGALAARLCGIGWRESGAIGVLMNTRGLMELIVLNIGLDLGVLTPTLFSMMVIMALVTTFLTTPLLHVIYPESVMARDLLEDTAPSPSATATSPRVLICLSHAEAGPGLVSIARALGGPGSDVIALHLASPSDRGSSRVGDAPDEVAAVLAPATVRATQLGVHLRPLSFVSSEPADDIARVADVRGADLAVLGLHRPVLSRTLLGGVVHDVMQHADTAVAVFVDRGLDVVRRVLVPFQGSSHDREALRLASQVQRHTGCAITILHVVKPGGGARGVSKDSFVETGGEVMVETIEHRSPADAALERSRDHDLVIVGVGREWGLGERRLGFGLRSEKLIRDGTTSLLVVRGPREEQPRSRLLATARIATG